jgi:hypothetical protein
MVVYPEYLSNQVSTPASGYVTKYFDQTSNFMVGKDSAAIIRAVDYRTTVSTTLSTPLNPTAFVPGTAGKMLGLGTTQTITPNCTGWVHATICGVIADATTNQATAIRLYMGTGAAPANGAGPAGTGYGADQTQFYITNHVKSPFSVSAIVTDLTIGTSYWIDGRVIDSTTVGSVTCTQVAVSAFEV